MRIALRIIVGLGILLASKQGISQSYNLSLRVVQVSHNYDCCDDNGQPCFFKSKPEPRYRVRARYGTASSYGTYSSVKIINLGDAVECGDISRNDFLFSATAVQASQIQVEVDMWEEDGCGSDVAYNGSCDDNRTFTSPIYQLSNLGTGTSTFSVTGSGGYAVKFEAIVTPLSEIEVHHNLVAIADGDNSPSTLEGTDFGSVNVSGSTETNTFYIRNLGAATLSLSGSPRVAINGSHAADFTVLSQPSVDTIASGDSLAFQIQFDPSKTGLRTAQVSIANNDPNENPYEFDIQGEGFTPCTTVQLIQAGSGTNTSNSNTITPLSTFFEDGRRQFLVLANEFSGLTPCTDSLYGMAFNVSANGPQSNITIGIKTTTVTALSSFAFESGFTQVYSGSYTPSAGWDMIDFDKAFAWNGTDNLIIEYCYDNSTFSNNTSVEYSTLSFNANRYAYTDASSGCSISSFGFNTDRPNMRFRLGALPEIEVRGNNTEIADGHTTPSTTDSTLLGNHSIGSTTTVTYYIKNTGSKTLRLTGNPVVSFGGSHASEFSVAQMPNTFIAAGDSTPLKIAFSPQGAGTRTATVNIANDDADENPYTFSLSGVGACNVSVTAVPTHISCNGDDNGKVRLNISGGVSPYTYGTSAFQAPLSSPLNKSLYDSVNMNVLQTSAGLKLTPNSAAATFLSKEKFKFQQGITFEGSVFLPDSGYRVVMVGLNDGKSTASTSVDKGVYFSEFSKTGTTNVYAISEGTGSGFSTSSYSTSSAGDWYDIKIEVGSSDATYYIKKSTESNYTNTKTLSYSSAPDSVKVGVYASRSSSLPTGFTLHKNWNVYYNNPDTVNLASGSYTYYVTDAKGCTASVSTQINEPSLLQASVSVDSNATCNGFSDAGASVIASGGTGAYTYQWSNNATVNAISKVTAGTYSVTVKDANNCSVIKSVSLSEPDALVANMQIDSNVTCLGDSNGGASLSVTGGTRPYNYTWSNTATDSFIRNVVAGTYSVTIVDAKQCSTTSSASITEPQAFSITAQVDSNVSCFGQADGKASVNASSDGLRITEVGPGSPDFIEIMNVGSGPLDVSGMKVVVSNSYSNINTFNTTTWNLSGSMASKAIAYREDRTGSNYWGNNLFWNTGSKSWALIIDANGKVVDALFWGWSATDIANFSITVDGNTITANKAWSGNGMSATCSGSFTRTGNSDSDTSSNWACSSISKGSQNSGLSIPFPNLSTRTPASYLWSNAATTPSISGLTKGVYSVIVKDSSGCIAKDTITITEPDSLVASLIVDSNETCAGSMDGGLTSSATGGTQPYTYAWSNKGSTQSITGVSAGNYSVTITDLNGCSDTASGVVTAPTLSIGSIGNVASVCLGERPSKIEESRATTGAGGNYIHRWQDSTAGGFWRFIKGGTVKEYQPGALTETTWFRRIDSAVTGCLKDTTNSIRVVVNIKPTADFAYSAACEDEQVQFIDSSAVNGGLISGYQWSFGNVSTSTQRNPVNVYKNTGTYSVRLIVSTDSSCNDTVTKQVAISPVPLANFSVKSLCARDTAVFSNTSTLASGTNNFHWSFGDSSFSTLAQPEHPYLLDGFYNVTLTATSDKGCKNSKTTILKVYELPVAQFAASNICLNDSMQFANNSQGANSYLWQFGNRVSSTLTSPNFLYRSSGNYGVQLVATSTNGCKDSVLKQVTVHELPVASFSASEACYTDSTRFINNTKGANSFLWNLGDGSSSSVSHPVHVYSKAGNYSAQLIATNGNNCKDTASLLLTVNALPAVAFNLNDTCDGKAVNMQNQTSGATSYAWNFGDGNGSISSNPSHTYSADGRYTVQLVATTAKGCKDSSNTAVSIHPLPQVNFSQSNVCDGKDMVFNNQSSISSGSNSYTWNFGDQNTSNNVSPSHQYSNDGNYTVQLIATSGNGCQDSLRKAVTVFALPKPAFSVNNECLSDSFSFQNNTVGANAQTWNFGDVTTSNDLSPKHIYSSAGFYTVTLTATSSNKCVDSISKKVQVYALPVAQFTANDVCLNDSTAFANNSQGANKYLWQFGNRASSTTASPNHLYRSSGIYNVQLVATTANGCKDSVLNQVKVHELPVANFSANEACYTDSTRFSNSTKGANSFVWNLGDGSSSTLSQPALVYGKTGNYSVQLIATTANGCKDTVANSVTVNALPAVAFNLNDTCDGKAVSMTNQTNGATSYAWSFGDGNGSISSNPSHTYSADGRYTVQLVATTAKGCKDSTNTSVSIHPLPQVNFSQSNVCDGKDMVFNNQSSISSGSNSYTWNFGDQNTSNNVSPSHQYSNDGNYSVQLIATSGNGCQDSVRKSVTVFALPKPAFSVNNKCLSDSFSFQNNTVGANAQTWNFGDVTTSNDLSPKHVYSSAGFYTVTLTATSTNKCVDSISKKVQAYALPVAQFTASDVCLNDSTAFANNSQGANSYLWQFGNRASSTTASPNHLYRSSGIYNVQLVATTANGCKDSVLKQVTVHELPVANFSANEACYTDSTRFSNSTKGANSFVWNLGDGSSSTLEKPGLVYGKAGNYSVQLIATTGNGCKDTVSNAITVNALPNVAFNLNDTCDGKAVSMTNQTNGATSYAWNFGDGNGSISNSPSHTYSTDGSYTVQLVATTAKGCKDSTFTSVSIHPLPQVNFSQSNVCDGKDMVFNNQSSISSGSNSYTWNFGDQNSSNNVSPSHQYSNDGNYNVQLIATSGNGCQDSLSKAVTVFALPKPAFAVNNECLSDSFTFLNNSSGSVAQTWDFGDVTTSNDLSPKHIYSSAGFYTVTLTAYSSNKCVDSISKKVQAYALPVAQFTASDVCLNDSTAFTNNSQGANNYLWQFGNRASSTTASPNHLYRSSGIYNVQLVATTANGCKDSVLKQVTVHELPVANFSANEACYTDSTRFSNSTKGANSFVWNLGDGSSSTLSQPALVYGKAGNYSVQLIATTAKGCKDTVANSVTVNTLPAVAFSLNDTCDGKAVNMQNQTVGATSYAWNFGDGNGSISSNPRHTYSADGSYTVQLVAITAKGCKDSTNTAVSIHPLPQVGFSQSNVCDGKDMVFNNQSSISSGSNSYTWSFGDQNTSNNVSPSHQYSNDGNYTVQLIATSGNGCQDSLSKAVTVFALPKPAFSVNNECLSDDFAFNNTSTGASTYQWSFGDASNSVDASPVHRYSASGYYSVALTATSANNCVDSVQQTVQAYEMPVAAFAYTNVCDKDSMNFSNNSQQASSQTWNFGDANTSSLAAPKHLYANDGNYTVELIVSTDKGCKDTISQSVRVHPLPQAGFSASAVCDGKLTSFNNTSVLASESRWDFGDTKGSNVDNPGHTYAASGNYTATLIVESAEGCLDTTSNAVTVHALPQPDFSVSNVCRGDTMRFNNNSTGAIGFDWFFGDGATSASTNSEHLYALDGSYEVQLIATSANNCVDSTKSLVEVYKKPIASFSNDSTCDGSSILFSNTSYYGEINQHEWNFGDNSSSGLVNVQHQYATHGSYKVSLTVTTDHGCKDTAEAQATVYPNPEALFSADNVCADDTMKFSNLSTVATGSIASQEWSLGDGSTETSTSTEHFYSKPGSYTVSLTTTTDKGCTNSYDSLMEVFVLPRAAYTVANHCYGMSADFSNLSAVNIGSIDRYEWSFGDAQTSSDEHPKHHYSTAGNFATQLVVESNNGCLDTALYALEVYEKPVASFNAPSVCHNAVTQFNNTSSVSVEWLWDFGDSEGFSRLEQPKHDYLNPGSYDVSLRVASENGCRDTVVQSITVFALPTANFSVASHCLLEDTEPLDASLGGIANWDWDFGDGQQATGSTPLHQYAKDGDYLIRLEVTDGNGCSDSVRRKVVVHPLPIVDIHNDTLVSKGYEVKLWASGGERYEWTPASGLFKSTSRQPVATVTEDITYTVRIETAYGCAKDTFVTLRVEEDYTVEPSNILTPDGNGQNDYWIVEKATYYEDVEVIVFDRWGRIVYQSKSYANDWDGTVNGKALPDGAYYYIINVPNERQDYKGSITIFR